MLTHCFSLSVGFRVMAVPETGRSPLTRSLSFHWEFISALLLEASTSLPLLKRAWKQTLLGHICPAAPRSRDKSAVCLSLPPSLEPNANAGRSRSSLGWHTKAGSRAVKFRISRRRRFPAFDTPFREGERGAGHTFCLPKPWSDIP